MPNYSQIANTIIKEANDTATLNGAQSFTSSSTVSNTIQTTITNASQNVIAVTAHASDVDGNRIVQVYELQVDISLYKLQDSANYKVSILSPTTTGITKLSSGTSNIKVNILLS